MLTRTCGRTYQPPRDSSWLIFSDHMADEEVNELVVVGLKLEKPAISHIGDE